jgi:hypothetical protein
MVEPGEVTESTRGRSLITDPGAAATIFGLSDFQLVERHGGDFGLGLLIQGRFERDGAAENFIRGHSPLHVGEPLIG